MEGKAVLFKKFAGIDVFDIEVDASDPDRFIEVVAALEPTFGAINLEAVKAPECFEIEAKLRRRMKIPVFHDDQHGRSEEHTSELPSLMRNSYAVFCLKTTNLNKKTILRSDVHKTNTTSP